MSPEQKEFYREGQKPASTTAEAELRQKFFDIIAQDTDMLEMTFQCVEVAKAYSQARENPISKRRRCK